MTRTRSHGRSRAGSDSKHDRDGLKGNKIYTKKGGGGGNFTWGLPGDEVFIPALNKGDPNYDSQEEDIPAVFLGSNGSQDGSQQRPLHNFSYLNEKGETLKSPKLEPAEFKQKVLMAARECFLKGNTEEFMSTVKSLDCTLYHYELVKKLIILSMEMSDREREMASTLLVYLQEENMLPASQVAKGFQRLFEAIDDIRIDIPSARKYLAQFLARCVADDVLPPAFLNDSYVEDLAGNIVKHAKVLLSIKNGLGRLEKVWGMKLYPSIEDLKTEIKKILLEYLSSADCTEVATLLRNLKVPFFHHEVVKRGVMISLEKKEREQAMISVLFRELVKNDIISSKQLIAGFQRLYEEMDDIVLDNPDGKTVIEVFVGQAIQDGCLTSDEFGELKVRAREKAELQKKLLEEYVSSGELGRTRAGSLPN